MQRVRRSALLVAGAVAGLLVAPESAFAHGLVGRSDLPIPKWLFGWAAAVVLVISFAALSTLWRNAKLEAEDGFRPLPAGISKLFINRVTDILAGAVGIALLALIVVSGLLGSQTAVSNFAPTFIYVVFWVGLVPGSILFGDIFRAFNPWRAIARASGFLAARVVGPLPEPLPYPPRLGRWPAVAAVLGFAWMELAYSSGDDPSNLAIATLVYTGLTLGAMGFYGSSQWIARGEGFSVYFNLLSRMSPVAVKDGRLGLRRPLAGLTSLDVVPGTVALLIVLLGTVTFDGASEGSLWADIGGWLQERFIALGLGSETALELSFTVGIGLGLLVISFIYAMGIAGVHTVGGRAKREPARAFVHSLVPIAAVYAIAHYFSFLVYNGQSIAPLASDPLGEGWDLLGTAGKQIDYGVIGANGIWYVQVGALVTGHVCALVLAHDRALTLYARLRDAVRSQYWMLAVMIGYTTFGLWLLSQANA